MLPFLQRFENPLPGHPTCIPLQHVFSFRHSFLHFLLSFSQLDCFTTSP
jgi:hypothetical protein